MSKASVMISSFFHLTSLSLTLELSLKETKTSLDLSFDKIRIVLLYFSCKSSFVASMSQLTFVSTLR